MICGAAHAVVGAEYCEPTSHAGHGYYNLNKSFLFRFNPTIYNGIRHVDELKYRHYNYDHNNINVMMCTKQEQYENNKEMHKNARKLIMTMEFGP